MGSTVLPDMEATLSPEQQSKVKRDLMVHCLNAKADWLETHLKKLLPPDVYLMAHNNEGPAEAFLKRQKFVARYMKKADIRMEEHGLNARLFKGKVLISQFFIKLAEQ